MQRLPPSAGVKASVRLRTKKTFACKDCGTTRRKLGYGSTSWIGCSIPHVEPETEEVIHCLLTLERQGSPKAAKAFALPPIDDRCRSV